LLTITLPCVTYQDEVTDRNQHDNLTDQGKIMKAVREKKRVTRRQVQSITGLGETQSKVLLNRLIEMGLLKRVGKGRATEYELNE
jgi:predicted transcriptional regulator of viral defense system